MSSSSWTSCYAVCTSIGLWCLDMCAARTNKLDCSISCVSPSPQFCTPSRQADLPFATGPFWLSLLFIRHLNILFFLDLNLLFFLDCYPLVLDSCTCTKLCYGMPTCCCWTRCDSSTRPQQCYLSRMGPTWIHNLLIWMEGYYFLTFSYLYVDIFCWTYTMDLEQFAIDY